ncbi:MAG: LptF/LptG family permease [Verrucomicrobia bacterium]|nr:LptF/LptG family permease [Verrucomicrobiota bacterium]
MRLLDLHLLRSFVLPFVYCEAGFFAVWLIADLVSNVQDFIDAQVSPLAIAGFYFGQLPAIAIIVLPIGLLLALLYCLSRLSQANEIISMLGAGLSLGRVLRPFFAVGLAITALSGFLNYKLAPHAEARRETELAELEAGNGKLEKRAYTYGYLFHNRTDNRLWFVQKMPTDWRQPLVGLQVVQQDAAGHITDKLYAGQATYEAAAHAWHFGGGTRLARFDANGDLRDQVFPEETTIDYWSETPDRIASSVLQAEHLSVPELHHYLRINSDFTHPQLAPFRTYLDYRHALPWECLVVVFVSAPLGIVYSRRNVFAGVAGAIGIFFLTLFLTNLCLALGRGDRIPPFWAAWTPNLLFFVVGAVLLRIRALNRDRLPRTWDELRSFVLTR